MAVSIERLFERHNIKAEDILYVTRNNQHTYIQTVSGDAFTTTATLKAVAEKLPQNEFWNIQKGVYVAKRHIANIDKKHNYTMTDGKVFEGRHRTPGEHNLHRKELFENLPTAEPQESEAQVLSFAERCAIMENAPIAFCVIELVFHENGGGIDFVFRYCNKEMEVLEGVPVEQMINRSFYEVFPGGDKKWIIPYADVALNGNRHMLREYSPEVQKNLIIRCFQPEKGYCACLLMVDEIAPQK